MQMVLNMTPVSITMNQTSMHQKQPVAYEPFLKLFIKLKGTLSP